MYFVQLASRFFTADTLFVGISQFQSKMDVFYYMH